MIKNSREYVISLGVVPLLIITGIMINLFFITIGFNHMWNEWETK